MSRKNIFRIIVPLLLCSVWRCCAEHDLSDKDDLPLWEAGVFCGAVRIPHYRGSDEYSDYFVPIPYFVFSLFCVYLMFSRADILCFNS